MKMKISMKLTKNDENKKFQRNMKKFGKALKKILKQLMVTKELNMGKIFKKLSLSLMMTCQWFKPIKLGLLTIIIVFSEGGKFYHNVF